MKITISSCVLSLFLLGETARGFSLLPTARRGTLLASSPRDLEPSQMRVRELKRELETFEISYADCLEKEDLVQRLVQARRAQPLRAPPAHTQGVGSLAMTEDDFWRAMEQQNPNPQQQQQQQQQRGSKYLGNPQVWQKVTAKIQRTTNGGGGASLFESMTGHSSSATGSAYAGGGRPSSRNSGFGQPNNNNGGQEFSRRDNARFGQPNNNGGQAIYSSTNAASSNGQSLEQPKGRQGFFTSDSNFGPSNAVNGGGSSGDNYRSGGGEFFKSSDVSNGNANYGSDTPPSGGRSAPPSRGGERKMYANNPGQVQPNGGQEFFGSPSETVRSTNARRSAHSGRGPPMAGREGFFSSPSEFGSTNARRYDDFSKDDSSFRPNAQPRSGAFQSDSNGNASFGQPNGGDQFFTSGNPPQTENAPRYATPRQSQPRSNAYRSYEPQRREPQRSARASAGGLEPDGMDIV